MSELRFPTTTRPLANSLGPLRTPTPESSPLPTNPFGVHPQPLGQLLRSGPHLGSNIIEAAPLIRVQSQAAAQFVDPSSASAQDAEEVDFQKGLKGSSTANSVLKAVTRASSRLGQGSRAFGAVAGLAGSALSLPGCLRDARSSLLKAWRSGDSSDLAEAGANTTAAASTTARLAKHSVETVSVGANAIRHRTAYRAGANAFRQAAPQASAAVTKAAASTAARQALQEASEKVARRATTTAATVAAKSGQNVLRQGAGVASRAAAKQVLREGGEAAAKAATRAVAGGALKAGAKAAGRFVPGLNVAIAALDTASAAATLADPKASTGKKITSCITAAGSIAAATNIPIVSQAGAVVSSVSSFVGSFF